MSTPQESLTDVRQDVPAVEPATEEIEPGEAEQGGGEKARKKSGKRKAKRLAAKGLAWFALISTALLVLAEPWLLLPMAALVIALALWD